MTKSEGNADSSDLLLVYTVSIVTAGFGIGVGVYGVLVSLLSGNYSLIAVFLTLGVVSLILSLYMYSEMIGSITISKTNTQELEPNTEDIPAIPPENTSAEQDESDKERFDFGEGEDPENVSEIINADDF